MARIVLSRLGSSANSFGMTNIFRFPLIESLSRSSENKIRQEIHTSSALLIGQRKGKKVRTITNRVREKLANVSRTCSLHVLPDNYKKFKTIQKSLDYLSEAVN